MAIGNEYNGNKIKTKHKLSICDIDIPIDPKAMYTVFDEEMLGAALLKVSFNHVDYFVDALVLRTHITAFESAPLMFEPTIYNDIKNEGELSIFWQKESYDLRTLLKRFNHKADAKKENDPNKLDKVDMTRNVIRKNKSEVVKKLINELGLSRQIARKYVKQIEDKTETRIFNFTVGEIFAAILEAKKLN